MLFLWGLDQLAGAISITLIWAVSGVSSPELAAGIKTDNLQSNKVRGHLAAQGQVGPGLSSVRLSVCPSVCLGLLRSSQLQAAPHARGHTD